MSSSRDPDSSSSSSSSSSSLPEAAGVLSHDDFLKLYGDDPDPSKLPSATLNAVTDHDYAKIESIILIHLDALNNIKSSVEWEQDRKTYLTTGMGMKRDARDAKPLVRQLNPDNPIIEADNM